MVIALPVSDEKKKEEKQETGIFSNEEERLSVLLSQVEGVGNVQVLIMSGENSRTDDFYHTKEPAVTGVLIAAQGADDPLVSRNLVEAAEALFQVEAHKIKVMKLK